MRDPEVEKIAAQAREHYGKEGFPNEGKLNVYRCQGKREFLPPLGKATQTQASCGRQTVTIDREPGVTPFIIGCPDCGGEAQSSMYRVPANLDPTHEWYRPDSLDGLKPGERDHVERGGLLLRPIKGVHEHRQPKWQRFVGTISQLGFSRARPGERVMPTVGIAPDLCPACETRRVLIACVAESGHEVNVGVAPELALLIADQIKAAALEVIEPKGRG